MKLKIGINLLLWTDRPNIAEHAGLFSKIKDWGFDGVEVPIDLISPGEAEALGAELDKIGLERTTISALDAVKADPASRERHLRESAIDTLKRSIECTRALGADLMCGPIFQGLGRFTGQGPEWDEWQYAVATIREVGHYARLSDVKIAMEPINRFEAHMVNTLSDGARFVREVGLPNIGLLADTHHGNIEEAHVSQSWENVSDLLYHVHISENNRGVPGSGHAVPGEIFGTLKRIKYDGWLTIEAFGQEVPNLISRLHLWRSFSDYNDDAAQLGIAYIKKQLEKW